MDWLRKVQYKGKIKKKWKLLWGKHRFKLLRIDYDVDLEKMTKDNNTIKLIQLEKMVKQWEKCILTPLGKVAIIKTFMIPIFNHLFISLPNPQTGDNRIYK